MDLVSIVQNWQSGFVTIYTSKQCKIVCSINHNWRRNIIPCSVETSGSLHSSGFALKELWTTDRILNQVSRTELSFISEISSSYFSIPSTYQTYFPWAEQLRNYSNVKETLLRIRTVFMFSCTVFHVRKRHKGNENIEMKYMVVYCYVSFSSNCFGSKTTNRANWIKLERKMMKKKKMFTLVSLVSI